jgi:hypothetical protein
VLNLTLAMIGTKEVPSGAWMDNTCSDRQGSLCPLDSIGSGFCYFWQSDCLKLSARAVLDLRY